MAKKQTAKKAADPDRLGMQADPTAEKPKVGRPTMFSPEVAERVCAKIAEGYTVEEIDDLEGLPSKTSIYRWLAMEDAPSAAGEEDAPRPYTAFRESYVRACELRSVPRFERIRALGSMAMEKPDLAQAVKVAADLEKWCLEREAPKKYGRSVTLKGSEADPLHVRKTVDLSDEALLAIAAGGLREAV